MSSRKSPAASRLICTGLLMAAVSPLTVYADTPKEPLASAWPQAYSVQKDKKAGLITLGTPYYTVVHDLKRGGAISSIHLTHGKVDSLLAAPLETKLRDESGSIYSDLNDPAPRVKLSKNGLTEIVSIDCRLIDRKGRALANPRISTRLEYHWGYLKIHKEFIVRKGGVRVSELDALNTVLAPSLSNYGYREGLTEEEGAPPFSFGSCRWGKLRLDHPDDAPVRANSLPRYLMAADPGVEGLEWFMGSDLHQWDLQLSDRRGQGLFLLQTNQQPAGLGLTIAPFSRTEPVSLTNSLAFDYYIGIPILDGHARNPWFHASFNRNKGDWVSADQIKRWAASGIETVHCHNDGDYYDDGLFWRDGSYPPYPDMDRYDQVIADCHQAGIRVATYFSNKELHPSTPEFQAHGSEWGRKSLKGNLQHNFYRGTNEFGVQMCLRSGWLSCLESSIDRVLAHHRLDGVYYDWNVALLCCNPAHQPGHKSPGAAAHWDIDELLQLMEWTRRRVGPNGLIIIHNTTTPTFATENFADHIVANEWGYGKWTGQGAELKDLPLEWSLVGARSRGVISYGQLDSNSPARLTRLFALEALLGGVTPWPASADTFQIFPLLKPIGNLENCRFVDWRNDAAIVSGSRCASAIYSRPGEAFILLANLSETADEVRCVLRPERLPYPLTSPRSATLFSPAGGSVIPPETGSALDTSLFTRDGVKVSIPGDTAVLIKVR